MAEKLCELRKKGGGEKGFDETVLWTNNSPTSDFAAQTITLSESIENYDYVKINWSATKASGATQNSILVASSDLLRMSSTTAIQVGLIGWYSSSLYARAITGASTTTITIGSATKFNASGTANNVSIPLSVIGCKFR